MPGKLSLRPRSDEGEEILLRRALLDDLDGFLQLWIVVERVAAHGRVTEGGPGDSKLDIAIDERRGRIPLLAIHLHASLLEASEELCSPLGLDREVGLHLRLHLVAQVV